MSEDKKSKSNDETSNDETPGTNVCVSVAYGVGAAVLASSCISAAPAIGIGLVTIAAHCVYSNWEEINLAFYPG